MCVGLVVVARILAGGENTAQRVPFVHRPCHYQNVRSGKFAATALARRTVGLRLQAFRPWDIVEADSPVAVVKAINVKPSGASESKSIISRARSSVEAVGFAAAATAKVDRGAGRAIGSKPRFRCTH